MVAPLVERVGSDNLARGVDAVSECARTARSQLVTVDISSPDNLSSVGANC